MPEPHSTTAEDYASEIRKITDMSKLPGVIASDLKLPLTTIWLILETLRTDDGLTSSDKAKLLSDGSRALARLSVIADGLRMYNQDSLT
jgi:hypothetical protein